MKAVEIGIYLITHHKRYDLTNPQCGLHFYLKLNSTEADLCEVPYNSVPQLERIIAYHILIISCLNNYVKY